MDGRTRGFVYGIGAGRLSNFGELSMDNRDVDESWEEYCARMRQDQEWITDVELRAAAYMLNREIRVYTVIAGQLYLSIFSPRYELRFFKLYPSRIGQHDNALHYLIMIL